MYESCKWDEMGYLPYQLVQDFFHQQYDTVPGLSMAFNHSISVSVIPNWWYLCKVVEIAAVPERESTRTASARTVV